MTAPDHAVIVRDALNRFANPITDEALAALDALVAERDEARREKWAWNQKAGEMADALHAAEAERDAISGARHRWQVRAEAAEAERDSVILAQSAINAQAARAEARVVELESDPTFRAAAKAIQEAERRTEVAEDRVAELEAAISVAGLPHELEAAQARVVVLEKELEEARSDRT